MAGRERVHGGPGGIEFGGECGVCGVSVGGVEVWGQGRRGGRGVGRGGVFGGVWVECYDA